MKNILKRTLATFLVVLMVLTAAPLQGFVGMEWDWLKIDLPEFNIESPFSMKAEAVSAKLTAEEAVDIFMSKSSKWKIDPDDYMYGDATYYFIDLDNDGVLELVASCIGGTGWFSCTDFYKISGNNVYKISSDYCEYDGLDVCFNDSIALYKNNKSSKMYYWGYNYLRNGWYENYTQEDMFYYSGSKISQIPLFMEHQICNENNNYEYDTEYWILDGTDRKTSKSAYDKYKSDFFKNYTNLNLIVKKIGGSEFESVYYIQKRNLLLESYNAFFHDGLCSLEFNKDEYEMYLGYTPQKGNTSQNCAWLSFKGNLDEFKLSDVKIVVENEKIAKVKELTSQQLLETSIDLFAYIDTKKIGETKITVKYKDEVMDESLIKVVDPNELKFEIKEPDYTYYEADRIFFDDSGFIERGGIKLKMKYSNDFVEGVSFPVTTPEKQELLKIKNAKIVFTIEEGAGLSFDNSKTVLKKEFPIEEIKFLEEVEDVLQIFCVDSNALGRTESITAKIKYSIMMPLDPEKPVEDSEDKDFTEKATDNLEFDVKSYKRHYVNEHRTAMFDEGKFKNVMMSGFAVKMKGVEDSWDFNFTQFLNDSLLKNLVDAASGLDEVKAYHIVVADLISTMNSDVDGSVNELSGKKLLESCSQLLELFVEVSKGDYFSEEMNKVISTLTPEAILNHLTALERKPEIDEITKTILQKSYYQKKLLDKLGRAETVTKICKCGGIVLNTFDDIRKVMAVNNALDTIEQMLVEQKDVLISLRDEAKSRGEYDLATALSAYTTYETDATDSLIKACVDSILMINPDSIFTAVTLIAGKQIKEAFSQNIKVTLGEKVFTGTVAGAFNTVMLAYEYGRLVSDLLFQNGAYADSCLRLVLAGHISENLKEVILDYHRLMLEAGNLDDAFRYAQSLDYALNMYKKVEIMACDSTVDALKARATGSFTQIFLKKKSMEYVEVIGDVKAIKAKLAGAYCHDTCLANIYAKAVGFDEIDFAGNQKIDNADTDFKVISVRCPVDVFVKDKKGEIVAAVENNIVTELCNNVDIVVIEDEKFICLPSIQEYDVEIVATDAGKMNYTVLEYGQESMQNIRRVDYNDVLLSKDKTFSTKLDTKKYTSNSNYNLTSDSEIITSDMDDYADVTSVSYVDNGIDSIYVGNEIKLDITTTPENINADKFNWFSSDESVATVCNGIVSGKKAGTVTITCEFKGNSLVKSSHTLNVTECNHSFSEWKIVVESTCNKYGTEKRECSVCGKTEINTISSFKAHKVEDETYTRPATCMQNSATVVFCEICDEVCQATDIPGTKLSHSFTKYVSDNNATYASDGTKTAKCDYGCGTKNTVTDNGTKLYVGKTSSLKATSTTNSVTLTWESVDGADGYRVYQYDFNKKASDKLSDVTSTSYTVKNLSSGKKYRFSVKAYKLVDGVKQWSNVYTIVRTATQPASVTKITVSPKSASVALSWTKIGGVDGYSVFRYNTDTKKWITLTDTASLSYTVKSLKANTQYRFAVKGYFIADNGEQIFASKYASVYATTLVGKTSSLKATPTNNSIKLTWSAVSGANGYRVYQYDYNKKASDKLTDTTSKSYTVKNLKPGKRCRFSVKAYKTVNGTKQWSDVYTIVVTATLPNSVSSLKTVAITTSTTKLSWSKASGATHYRVFVKDGSKWRKLKDVTGTTYTVTKMKSGTKYTFAVRAFAKIDGKEVLSAKYPTLHTASKPTTPSITKITTSSGKARLYWSAVSGETGYTVYYSTKKDSGFKKYANYKANSTNGYVSDLTKGKTYYFKVRCYIDTDSGYVYSAWSAVKGVKVK